MSDKAIVSRTTNGAWVRFLYRDVGEPVRKRDMSFAFDAYKHDGDEMSGLTDLLYELMDDMGWTGDRHDKRRVEIRIVHGDKYEHTEIDPKEGCPICQDP